MGLHYATLYATGGMESEENIRCPVRPKLSFFILGSYDERIIIKLIVTIHFEPSTEKAKIY